MNREKIKWHEIIKADNIVKYTCKGKLIKKIKEVMCDVHYFIINCNFTCRNGFNE